jgi:hypothetical protein
VRQFGYDEVAPALARLRVVADEVVTAGAGEDAVGLDDARRLAAVRIAVAKANSGLGSVRFLECVENPGRVTIRDEPRHREQQETVGALAVGGLRAELMRRRPAEDVRDRAQGVGLFFRLVAELFHASPPTSVTRPSLRLEMRKPSSPRILRKCCRR